MVLIEFHSDVSRPDGEVTITIWDRAGATPGEGEGFLGMMKIRPSRINGKLHDNWFRCAIKRNTGSFFCLMALVGRFQVIT